MNEDFIIVHIYEKTTTGAIINKIGNFQEIVKANKDLIAQKMKEGKGDEMKNLAKIWDTLNPDIVFNRIRLGRDYGERPNFIETVYNEIEKHFEDLTEKDKEDIKKLANGFLDIMKFMDVKYRYNKDHLYYQFKEWDLDRFIREDAKAVTEVKDYLKPLNEEERATLAEFDRLHDRTSQYQLLPLRKEQSDRHMYDQMDSAFEEESKGKTISETEKYDSLKDFNDTAKNIYDTVVPLLREDINNKGYDRLPLNESPTEIFLEVKDSLGQSNYDTVPAEFEIIQKMGGVSFEEGKISLTKEQMEALGEFRKEEKEKEEKEEKEKEKKEKEKKEKKDRR